MNKQKTLPDHEDIAIVGMAGIFPGAQNPGMFWNNILNRVNSIREVDKGRWRVEDFFDPNPRSRDRIYSKWGGFLEDIPFDPTEFGIPPVTLKSVDAVQLIALMVSRKALEDAGLNQREIPKERTAVIFGAAGMNDQSMDYIFRTMLMYYLPRVQGVPEDMKNRVLESCRTFLPEWTEDSFPGILGNVISGRVANRLDLNGSNFTVDAACASSLAALDVGISKLRSHQADAALVGAVDITDNVMGFMAFSKTMVLSPEGKSRPFDDQANGIVISEGVAALVLKRLSDAEKNGDRIHAVIKGIGSSSDGKNRSLTAPHPRGQLLAIQRAYQDAGIDSDSIGLIEAHGTGTVVGDQSEFEALNLAFEKSSPKAPTCAVGSVKSNIGHTKVAAGLAGLIKGVMALKYKILPATIGIEKPNTRIDFSKGRFYLNTENRPWLHKDHEGPRRCGVSAFGFGGTNFHVVLEEHPEPRKAASSPPLRDAQIFTFSSKDTSDLVRLLEDFCRNLNHPEFTDARDLARSLYIRDRRNPDRPVKLDIVAESVAALAEKLVTVLETLRKGGHPSPQNGTYFSDKSAPAGKVCFLFPGQGSQKVNMFRDLLMAFPECRRVFEEADKVLDGWFDRPLSEYVYPVPAFSKEEQDSRTEALNKTQIAQPAMAAADIAAWELLKRFGICPDFSAGHSFGEYIALHTSGVVNRADAIRLAAIRGRLSGEATARTSGKMAAILADSHAVEALLKASGTRAKIANINTPRQTVIGGTGPDIEKCIETAKIQNMKSKIIPVTAAFHTPLMKAASEKLALETAKIKFHSPLFPVYSNTTGAPYPKTSGAIRKLLARHIQEPLDFISQIHHLRQDGAYYFIEVGPGRVLSGLVDQILTDKPHVTLSMEHPGHSGSQGMAHFLAHAHALGISTDLSYWFGDDQPPGKDLEMVLKEAEDLRHPSPMTWRIKNGKAEPWSAESESVLSGNPNDASKISLKPGNESNEILTHTKRPHEGSTNNEAMQSKKMNPKTPEDLVLSPETQSLILRIQANLDHFMELQRSQHHLMERYLDMQQQLINAALNGAGKDHGSIPEENPEAKSSPSSVHAQVNPHFNMPPIPVLPKLTSVLGQKHIMPSGESGKPNPASSAEQEVKEASKTHQSKGQFQVDLLRTVSELTGYPEEMLGLDAHLEADLGIDSIKRVEIFSLLEEHHPLLESHDEGAVLEELANLNTLRKIIDWYETNLSRMQEKEKQTAKKY